MSSDLCARRRFLKVVAHGGVLAGAASLGVGCGGNGLGGPISAGNVKTMALGSLATVSGAPVAIGRDAGGLYAMTLICTHAGCDISQQGEVSAQGVVCNCHGSRFDVDGNVLSGPAPAPLEHFQVVVDTTGEVTIDSGTPVAESIRTAVTTG